MTGSLMQTIEALGLMSALLWTVKASAALAAGLVAARAARRAKASVRFLLLAATFAGLLALPALMAFAPPLTVPVPAPFASPDLASPSEAGVTPSRRESREPVAAPAGPRTSSASQTLSLASTGAALRTTWALVAAWLTALLAWSVWRLGRLARAGVPWRETQPLADRLAAAAGLRRAVHVVRHEAVAAPFTCGVLRPVIVLPWDACEWSDDDVRRALVHEIEHVRRGDWLVLLLARLTCGIYWFHPLAWRALRGLSLEAERACDDAVVAASIREDYADQLVALAGRVRAATALPMLAMAGRSDLSVRVRALLDEGQRRGRVGSRVALATLSVACLGAGVLGAAVPGSASPAGEQVRRGPATVERDVEREDEGDSESSEGYALYHAASRGNLRVMLSLLDGGADVNARLGGDGSPLIGAARNGRLPAVLLLLDRGADVNLGVRGDGNPLIAAAARGHLAVAQLLLDRGAQVDAAVDGDENPLIQASAGGHLAVVKLLVERGADVNARIWAERYDGVGEWRTPLSQARRGGHPSVVEYLESIGARP